MVLLLGGALTSILVAHFLSKFVLLILGQLLVHWLCCLHLRLSFLLLFLVGDDLAHFVKDYQLVFVEGYVMLVELVLLLYFINIPLFIIQFFEELRSVVGVCFLHDVFVLQFLLDFVDTLHVSVCNLAELCRVAFLNLV